MNKGLYLWISLNVMFLASLGVVFYVGSYSVDYKDMAIEDRQRYVISIEDGKIIKPEIKLEDIVELVEEAPAEIVALSKKIESAIKESNEAVSHEVVTEEPMHDKELKDTRDHTSDNHKDDGSHNKNADALVDSEKSHSEHASPNKTHNVDIKKLDVEHAVDNKKDQTISHSSVENSTTEDKKVLNNSNTNTDNLKVADASLPHPKVAILVLDLGIDAYLTERAMKLPKVITLGFSPYSFRRGNYLQIATDAGYTTLVGLPLKSREGATKVSLSSDLSSEDNMKILDNLLHKAEGICGVYTEGEDNFFGAVDYEKLFLNKIHDSELLFLYGGSKLNIDSIMKNISGFQLFSGGESIDKSLKRKNILASLEEVKEKASVNGFAIAVTRAYPVIFEVLTKWVEDNKELVVPMKKLIK